MKRSPLLVCATLFSLSLHAAERAGFDFTSGVLSIPTVTVQENHYYDVQLQKGEDWSFTLIDFSSTASGSTAEASTFDPDSGILTIPSLSAGELLVYSIRFQSATDGGFSLLDFSNEPSTSEFTLTSEAIADGQLLDAYRCEQKVDDIEASIPLAWSGVPDGTGALAITMHHYPNPDDTRQANSYLLLWGIAPSVSEIPHGGADDGDWFMGPNKDGTAISYTSPCSHSSGTHSYTLTLYALSETPASLPQGDSMEITYESMIEAFNEVEIIDVATLPFDDVTE